MINRYFVRYFRNGFILFIFFLSMINVILRCYKYSINDRNQEKSIKNVSIEISNHLLSTSNRTSSQPSNFITLEDISNANIKPENGKNIFFIDTVRMKKRMKQRPFTARQACAVESAGERNFKSIN